MSEASGDDGDDHVADDRDGAADDRDGAADEGREESDEEEYEPSLAGVFGARDEGAPVRPEIVPESPSLENAAFVLLGVLLGLFVLFRAASVFAG